MSLVTVACLVSQLTKHHTELLVAFLTAVDGVDKHDAEALRAAVNDDGCEEGVHNILFPLMDVETGEIILVVSAVVSNGKEAVTIDPNLASRYDVSQTYKQYKMSPHKEFWRTAMELKMEAYEAVPPSALRRGRAEILAQHRRHSRHQAPRPAQDAGR